MRISIVMTYFNRKYQLEKTLFSLMESEHKDFSIVIVDDASDIPLAINGSYGFPIEVINITKEEKQWTNPEPAYNKGIIKALESKPDIIFLQNAECYHTKDVLKYANDNLTELNYLSFGCFSLDEKTTFSEFDINEIMGINNCGAIIDGENAWYNHSIHRPVAYDFCSAITANNLRRLNGYDERFSNGVAYGDNYLLNRIKMLGLDVRIIDFPFVVHQWHYTNPSHPNQAGLLERNSNLLIELTQLNNYKADHLFTPDL
jgi:glycosyltransferase involved in cell wall biosynthesis